MINRVESDPPSGQSLAVRFQRYGRRSSTWMVGAVVAATLLAACRPLPPIPPTPSPDRGCAQQWGSDPALAGELNTSSPVTDVRSGSHECFDRLVVDLDGGGAGWDVRYVDAVLEPGRGDVVPLRGAAALQVVVRSPAYDPVRVPTYDPAVPAEAVDVTGYPSFRQVAYVGSYEGRTTLGMGVRARLPFRAFHLDGPGDDSRIVIDVAHRWN